MDYKLDVDYYIGASSAIIRMAVCSAELLSVLKTVIGEFVSGKLIECRFGDFPFVTLTGLLELNMRVVSTERRKSVDVVRMADGQVVVYWSNTTDGWDQCLGLLDGFSDLIPGHQYLSEEGIDDALIVVAFLGG